MNEKRGETALKRDYVGIKSEGDIKLREREGKKSDQRMT